MLSRSPAVVPSVLFERAWDAAPIGKAVVDLDRTLIRGNPALERMLEAEDGRLVGASLVEVVGELLLDPDAPANEMFEDEHDVVLPSGCLLYTSDAADDLLCVDLGGRRI